MDPKQEVVDIITAAEIYIKKLEKLDVNIKRAENQIINSASDSLNNIELMFDTLKNTIIYILDTRKLQLEEDIKKIELNGLKPLRECQEVITDKINKTNMLISNGKQFLNHGHNPDEFYAQSDLLGHLPAVPSLLEVPCIHFTYPDTSLSEIAEICKNFGTVYHNSPVQIHSLIEKPGAILIEWEENDNNIIDDRLNSIQEYKVQYAFGDCLKQPPSQLQPQFYDCYIGTNTEYLKKDLKLNEPYSFRVCCKMEESNEWSPWSVVQVAKTQIQPFSWDENQTSFTLNNDGKIATKTLTNSAILHSKGPQFKPQNSIEFTILDMDKDDSLLMKNGVGLCDVADINALTIDNYYKLNTFIVLLNGNIYIEGNEKSTRLPQLKQGSKISFTCQETNNKVRIYIESEEKNVTYDWKISNREKMYFFLISESPCLKVLVE